MNENDISYKIIGAIYKVNSELGPGLLEKVYEKALVYQLQKDGLNVQSQVKVPVKYRDIDLDMDLYLDILVENKVIVELKSVSALLDVHYKQLFTYLKLSNKHLGLLVNFNSSNIREDIHRVVRGIADK